MSSARFGIPTDQPATQPRLCSSSHVVAPTPRYNPTGPAGPPELSYPPNDGPSNSPRRIFVLAARVTMNPPKRIPGFSKGEPRTLGFPATLVEFFAPSAHQLKRVHFTPVYLAGYVPPSGFFTLSTAFSSLKRPALFHAGNAHGVSLYKGFPSQPGPADSSPQNDPLGVFPRLLDS